MLPSKYLTNDAHLRSGELNSCVVDGLAVLLNKALFLSRVNFVEDGFVVAGSDVQSVVLSGIFIYVKLRKESV